jgi:hypothetical protein
MKSILTAALLLFATSAFATSQYAWIEYGPKGPIARVILPGSAQCPNITVNGGTPYQMTLRAPSNSNDYNVTSCEVNPLPAGTTSAVINGQSLPVAKIGQTTKIAIIGDTGCREKVSGGKPDIQDCANDWGFPDNVAAVVAWNPDLVIHVGDYYYREAKQQNGTWVKAGYNWSGWESDFFSPANPLLQNAPWIFTRGNHEMCTRAASGWFRFLDPRTYAWENQTQCTSNLDFTPPYWFNVGSMTFAIMDVSAADDTNPNSSQSSMFAGQLATIQRNVPAGTWLLLHMPFWALQGKGTGTPVLYNAWSQANPQPTDIGLVLAGHKHLMETLDFSDGKVAQLIIGNGGTELTGMPTFDQSNPPSTGGRTPHHIYIRDAWGFMTATPNGTDWTMQSMSNTGVLKATCVASFGSFNCSKSDN